MITIEKTNKLKSKASCIYISHSVKTFSDTFLTKQEKNFIIKKAENDEQSLFAFNRYTHWEYYLILPEEINSANLEKCRKEGDSLAAALNKSKENEVYINAEEINKQLIYSLVEGIVLGSYQFIKYKTGKEAVKKANTLKKVFIISKKVDAKKLIQLNSLLDAVYKTRDMVNEPVAFLNAVKLAEITSQMCKAAGARVDVMHKQKIESLKMGGLLAVNQGSVDPPTFTVIEWKPVDAINKKPFVFVGKGVVYDTGGINIKTYPHMETMKCDMAGGATVSGLMYAIAKTKLPVYAIGLIPATDNRPCGNAYVPGDIITMHNGTKVEMLNSDAEGRMILADALSYAKKYKPELVIDLATLTGAAHAAIGKYALVAMGSNYGKYMEKIKDSGNNVYERVVEFPMWDEYKELIKSEVADIKNIGGPYAGAISAGKFLEHFTEYPWIHFDIAGPAFMDSRDSYRGQGGTGFGLRLLYDFLAGLIK